MPNSSTTQRTECGAFVDFDSLAKILCNSFWQMLLCYSNRAFICYALVCVLPTYERICACHVRIDIKRLQWQRERKGNNRDFHALKNWNAYTSTLGRILAMKFRGFHVFWSFFLVDRWVKRASEQANERVSLKKFELWWLDEWLCVVRFVHALQAQQFVRYISNEILNTNSIYITLLYPFWLNVSS